MTHPDVPAEQAYLDHAYVCLDRMRERVGRVLDVAAGEIAALALEKWQAQTLQSYEDAERGICFGRIDMDEGDNLYVGRRWIHEDDQSIVVVNWQAPAARPFYTATPVVPQRVHRRRRFRTEGRRLLDIADETLGGTIGDEPRSLGDFLLEELERSRDERMRDIVETIQADQYRLIAHETQGVLVVQGGPGTGKTAVGLHRASWLLFTHARRLRREGVLVVGPNRTFIEYVSHVLPSLGETSVVQRAIGDLREGSAPEVRDEPAVERRKGDAGMAKTLRETVEAHRREPQHQLEAMLGMNYVARPAAQGARDRRGGVGGRARLGRRPGAASDGPPARLLPGVQRQARRGGHAHVRGAGEGARKGRLPETLRRRDPAAARARAHARRGARALAPAEAVVACGHRPPGRARRARYAAGPRRTAT